MPSTFVPMDEESPRLSQPTYQAIQSSDSPPEKGDLFSDRVDHWRRATKSRSPWSTHTLALVGALLAVVCTIGLLRQRTTDVFHIDSWGMPGHKTADVVATLPSSDHIRDYFLTIASETHLAGSEADKTQAEWVRDKWVEFGVPDVTIETYYPTLNYPTTRRLAIVEGPAELLYEATLREEPIEQDPSTQRTDRIPTFHAYSGDGDVTGPVVYVNYGRPEDFERLIAQGVSFKDTIALIRSGRVSRGLQVRAAQEYGCVGALLYPDPIDDGPIGKMTEAGDDAASYPNGPWRAATSVERGTVHFLSLMAGDPFTPGYAATEDATRLKREEVDTIPHIPSLPISWNDALPLLKATEGFGVEPDADWVGGIAKVGYFSGPSEAKVNLVNKNTYEVKPIWNVIGRIEGTTEPDHAVILGNHRDAWGFGAADPSSGTASLMELVRVLGVLLDRGWRPRRTIIFASWDAEEYGSVGSTEWVEDHLDWLQAAAVAYINVDAAVTGPHFTAQASPLLHRVLYEVASEVIDPKTSLSVLEAWTLDHDRLFEASDLHLIQPLGAGSDYVSFFEHAGVSSLTMGFRGEYGVRHSDYDSVHWMKTFGDPTFEYHRTLTKIWGLLALRLADDVMLPMYPLDYAERLLRYMDAFKEEACVDANKKKKKKEGEGSMLPHLLKQIQKLRAEGRRFTKTVHKVQAKTEKSHSRRKHYKTLRRLNDRLVQFERAFIDPAGLPDRPWYRHVVYAPSMWSGYHAEIFPGLGQVVQSGNEEDILAVEQHLVQIIKTAKDVLRGKHKATRPSDPEDDEPEDDDDDDDDQDDDNNDNDNDNNNEDRAHNDNMGFF